LRKNVAFFADPAAAETAGFRACKRCRPADASRDEHALAVAAAARATIDASDGPIGLATLAADAGLSRFHFQRLFTRVCGMSPKAYEKAARLRRVRAQLEAGAGATTAAYEAGYGSSSRFYEDARAFGMTPNAVRTGGADLAILLGADEAALRDDLAARFPRARYMERPAGAADVPLDLYGTAFQRRVWRELQNVPSDATTTYTALAAAIGAPAAVRAVANACASNPAAVAVPCHRVVRRDGGLGGYRWGLARKRALLAREGGA
jgi:AraC family transcriptional regulator of adaptative response/methylated-DNA-[protein]-cysteine methyltransferase